MRTKNLVLKIISAVLCACSIIPLFLNFITLRNGDNKFSYNFASTSGTGDVLVIISRILFIITIVIAMILLVGIILQFFIKDNYIINWIVIGASIMIMITATLCFVGTLLYCLSISKIGEYVWFPAVGCYILLGIGIIAPILSMMGEKKEGTK